MSPTPAYFFVSYAHLPPLPPLPGSPDEGLLTRVTTGWEGDTMVKDFFQDLSTKVGALAPRDSPLRIGLYDRTIGTGLAAALAAAEVLVPLYSPRYVNGGSWAMRERESFRQRLRAINRDTAGHVQPVLWVPLEPGDPLPDDDGDLPDIASDIPEYAENGLRMLCELPPYRYAYQTIVNRLAKRIVEVVHNSPIGPSDAPLPIAAPTADAVRPRFVVAVSAPTRSDPPPGRPLDQYGEARADWRPAADDGEPPLASQAASVAERLDLPTRVVDLPGGEADVRVLPTVVLIDPWIINVPGGQTMLAGAMNDLPDWATAVVVVDGADPAYADRGQALRRKVDGLLADAGVRHLTVDVSQPGRLTDAMPALVMQTRRKFLSRTSTRYPSKPKLADPAEQPGTGRKATSSD